MCEQCRTAASARQAKETARRQQVHALLSPRPATPPGKKGGTRPAASSDGAASADGAAGRTGTDDAAAGAASPKATDPTARWLEVELLDAAGRPLGDAPFRVTDAAGKTFLCQTDAQGTARVEGLEAGDCRVELVEEAATGAHGNQAAASASFPAPAAEPRAAEADWAELEVAADDGTPLKEAGFEITDAAGKKTRGRTDASGRARVTGLAPGAFRVQVDAERRA